MKRDEEYGKIKKTEAENNQKNEIRETATGSSENKAKKEGKEIGTLFLSSAGGAGRIQGSY